MLLEIKLKNFKCFKDETRVPLNRINLFTGLNSRGKSTVLQALLLMRQSIEHSKTTRKIMFNGNCVNMGRFHDVKNSAISIKKTVEIGFKYKIANNYFSILYKLRESDSDDMVADISKIEANGVLSNNKFKFSLVAKENSFSYKFARKSRKVNYLYNLFISNIRSIVVDLINKNMNFANIHYISADRIGPQEFYSKTSLTDFPNVGVRGEYTANLLSKKKNDIVDERLRLPEGLTETVLDQTQSWLSKIFKGGNINVEALESNIITLKLSSDASGNFYKPINVGFGYSYALPIIVSGLIAKKGEILIVENPEAHLHPSAQAEIIKFLARVGAAGIQVFIESHSDHILNGLRLSVLEKIIAADEISIIYFSRENETLQIKNIIVEQDGRIETWPDGFFDQTERDFERLFNI